MVFGFGGDYVWVRKEAGDAIVQVASACVVSHHKKVYNKIQESKQRNIPSYLNIAAKKNYSIKLNLSKDYAFLFLEFCICI